MVKKTLRPFKKYKQQENLRHKISVNAILYLSKDSVSFIIISVTKALLRL